MSRSERLRFLYTYLGAQPNRDAVRTLAARLGRERGSWLYAVCVAGAALGVALGGEPLVGLVVVAAYVPALRLAFSPRAGRDLIALLVASARAQLAVGVLLVVVFFATR